MGDQNKCAVFYCPNAFPRKQPNGPSTSSALLPLFKFPSAGNIQSIWKRNCDIPEHCDVKDLKICSNHFSSCDFGNEAKTLLRSTAIPTQNLDKSKAFLKMDCRHQALLKEFKELEDKKRTLVNALKQIETKNESVKDAINKQTRNIIINQRIEKSEPKQIDILRKIFSVAQVRKIIGKKRIVWSDDDMAMAFSLRHLGNRECYLYLKNTLNMPLPSLSAVQRWAASK